MGVANSSHNWQKLAIKLIYLNQCFQHINYRSSIREKKSLILILNIQIILELGVYANQN